MKHPHYKKPVKGLDFIDVYRVLDLFEVTDPCLQHAIKKLLCAGLRGAKDMRQDVQEAIDTLNRRVEMWNEKMPETSIDAPEWNLHDGSWNLPNGLTRDALIFAKCFDGRSFKNPITAGTAPWGSITKWRPAQ